MQSSLSASPTASNLSPLPLGCQICGRQDETVRWVAYPFVISFLVITFRRAFSGVWCRRHRTFYWIASTVITSVLGWVGIPFGFIYTPLTLIRLAQGGVLSGANARMLREIAAEKQRQGDIRGARRCLEASLEMEDDPGARQELSRLHAYSVVVSPDQAPGFLPAFVAAALVVIGVTLLGFGAGLAHYYLGQFISAAFHENMSLYGLILAWTPFVAMAMLVLLAVRQLFLWLLRKIRLVNVPLGVAFAIFTSALAVYAIASGRGLAEFMDYVLVRPDFASFQDFISVVAAVIGRGGLYEILFILKDGSLFSVIYTVLLVCFFFIFLLALHTSASQYAIWQTRLVSIEEQAGKTVVHSTPPALAVFAGAFLAIAALSAAFPQKTTVDYLEALVHRGNGYQYLESGKANEAIIELKTAVSLRPTSPAMHEELGWAYLQAGESDQALAEFQQALRLSPDDPDAHFGAAQVYYSEQSYEQARQEYEAVLKLQPSRPDAQVGLGWVQLQTGHYDQALQAFQETVKAHPKSIEAYEGLGMVYMGKEDYEKSKQAFRQAIQIDPKDYLGHEGLGRAYYYNNELDEAVTELDSATSLNPKDVAAYFFLGMAHTRRGEYEKAVPDFEKVISMEPDWSAAHAFLAYACYNLGQEDRMQQEIQKANSARLKDPISLFSLSIVYQALREYKQAEAYLLQAIDASPDSANIYINLAYAYSNENKFDQARQAIQKALELKPDYAFGYQALGMVFIDAENLSEAEQHLQHALRLDPRLPDAHSALSFLYFQQGKIDQAIDQAKAAIQDDPYHSSGYANLAFAQRSQGKLFEAIQNAEKSVSLSPKNDVGHFILGMCYLESGKKEEVVTELRQFLDLYWERAYVKAYKQQAEAALKKLEE